MTDKELLEKAAKAAGIGGGWDWPRGAKSPTFWRSESGKAWIPLTDDGDALRLAVKCGIDVSHNSFGNVIADRYSMPQWEKVVLPHGADPCAATRRAIVRAAATIGESMP